MSLISSICCVNCSQIYDESRKPCIGTCQDSVCQLCRNQMKVFTCPTCGKKDAFKEEQINYHGLPMQETILNQLTEDNIQEFIKKQNDKNSGPCQECGDLAKKLRICLDCAAKQGILVPWNKKYNINYSGATILGAFYKTKQFSICANCATDGEHAEHKCDQLANVYDEETVNHDLNFALTRILDMKFEREMKKHEEGSEGYWLNFYKQMAVRIETSRRETRGKLPEYVLAPLSGINAWDVVELQKRLNEVMERNVLYQRRLKMMYVEDIQRRFWISDDEEFKKEMRKVAGKILKEEEKLGREELLKVNRLIRERILKHCDSRRTANDDFKEGLEKYKRARVYGMEKGEAFIVAVNRYHKSIMKTPNSEGPFFEIHCKETEDSETLETVFIPVQSVKETHEAYVAQAKASIEFYRVDADEVLCTMTHLETKELLFGRGFKLAHPNRLFLLLLFWLQLQLEPVINSVWIGNFIR